VPGLEWLLVGALGVWRVTHLLHAEAGPWELFERLRSRLADAALGRVVACFYCLSLWVAVPVALVIGRGWVERALLAAALSGAAILLERATAPAAERLPASYFEAGLEAEETDDALLPTSAGRAPAALAEPARR
jgi:hypothetical protein